MRRLTGPILGAFLVVAGLAADAVAVPVLQLDIAGGTYDEATETIVGPGNPFTVYAIGTPQGKVTTNALLSDTFYLSVAVSPQVGAPAALGYFTINGQRVDVTEDMTYGTPPIELFDQLQDHDAGDLPKHSIYPTYFAEFEFQFSSSNKINEYNTQDRAQDGGAGPTASSIGTSYYHQWVIDTSHLDPAFVLHFDLYNAETRRCSRQDRLAIGPSCQDTDVAIFAPFSHDAQSPPVPEPTTMVLVGTGLALGAMRRYRRGRSA